MTVHAPAAISAAARAVPVSKTVALLCVMLRVMLRVMLPLPALWSSGRRLQRLMGADDGRP